MGDKFAGSTPTARFLRWLCWTVFYVGAATLVLISLRAAEDEGFQFFIFGLFVGVPMAALAALFFAPIAAIVSLPAWISGHLLGQALRLSLGWRGSLAALLAGTAWWAFTQAVSKHMPFRRQRGPGDPIQLPALPETLFEFVAETSFVVPVVGAFVAFRIYSHDA